MVKSTFVTFVLFRNPFLWRLGWLIVSVDSGESARGVLELRWCGRSIGLGLWLLMGRRTAVGGRRRAAAVGGRWCTVCSGRRHTVHSGRRVPSCMRTIINLLLGECTVSVRSGIRKWSSNGGTYWRLVDRHRDQLLDRPKRFVRNHTIWASEQHCTAYTYLRLRRLGCSIISAVRAIGGGRRSVFSGRRVPSCIRAIINLLLGECTVSVRSGIRKWSSNGGTYWRLVDRHRHQLLDRPKRFVRNHTIWASKQHCTAYTYLRLRRLGCSIISAVRAIGGRGSREFNDLGVISLCRSIGGRR